MPNGDMPNREECESCAHVITLMTRVAVAAATSAAALPSVLSPLLACLAVTVLGNKLSPQVSNLLSQQQRRHAVALELCKERWQRV